MSRNEKGRGFDSIEDSIDSSISLFNDIIIKSKKSLIRTIRNNRSNLRINKTTTIRKQIWEEKQLYGYFKETKSRTKRSGHGWEMEALKEKPNLFL